MELGEFLKSRRARLQPADAGLPSHGERRRVPGLRREELAQLAGVSAAYYTRLEQGQSRNASDAVLEALARVLRLDEDERTHLLTLARPGRRPQRPAPREQLRSEVRVMIESFRDVPALVLGRRTDILAWNRMAHALLARHLDFGAPERTADRPNWTRMFFLDPQLRELFTAWPDKARDTVADLRMIAGRYPDDSRLAALIGELAMKSAEFARLWAQHSVRGCASHSREYHHPVAGRLTLTDELLALTDEGQRIAVFTAEPGSPSEAALGLLAPPRQANGRPT
ncbi:helix-turn-helix domain-containing protein [Amycolatopsis viridis]|uniref:Transcriptional regulator with XRE-family HTH domain n=1 Tax=Amycolatopsis viridis TaxID=185678 RepID=A0ABX0SM19_9PSEU|nr:helix-turn-helix transcriptional regulator [Amycolatopsis viridis]NIH78026.1 transcriptional regulator with XRE-family HTH domain [Amycolatopsis viridis]